MKEISMVGLVERIPDEAAAYEFFEEMRWNGHPVCPHCDSDEVSFMNPANGLGRKTRTGATSQRRVWQCRSCRKQFSVLTGTVMHGTKIPVRKWVFVLFEMASNKNGVAAREIERRYDLTPKAAWFLLHRIRTAMEVGPLAAALSGTIVADETLVGGEIGNRDESVRATPVPFVPHHHGWPGKTVVLSLINKDSGEVRSRVVPNVTGHTLRKVIAEQVDMAGSHLHTDSAPAYRALGEEFVSHETVNHHAGEYVRGNVTTNHAEGYFSQLKRSLDGTHHHVSREHLPRYLAEFDFRYSTRKLSDTARMVKIMGQVGGRRLTYRPLVDN